MTWICPECMGTMESTDGQQARCTVHGGEYQILFSHWRPSVPSKPASRGLEEMTFQVAPGAVCYQHQNSPATNACQSCGSPVCEVCVFKENGTAFCPNCIVRQSRSKEASDWDAPSIPPGTFCVQHRTVAATQKCKACGAYMCSTCDFTLPDGVHVCPACAVAPNTELSSRRKKQVIGSFVAAAVGTLGTALLMTGALAETNTSKEAEAALGYAFMFLVLVPGIVGLSLAFSAKAQRGANPISLWIALIWNSIIIGGFLLLCIIGNFT